MHALIDATQAPISKSHDFFEQAHTIEATLSDKSYSAALHRYRSLSKALFLIKILFIIGLLSLGISLLFPNSTAITDASQHLASYTSLTLLTLIGIATVICMIGLIICLIALRSLSASLVGPRLSQWWNATLHRWMPDLAAKHAIATLSPESIANLVAVQTKIQEIDLDVKDRPTHP